MLGVYWKIQVICYQMGTEIFKIEEEMTEKMKPEVANPPPKMGRILCSQYTLIDPLSHFFFNFENLSAYMVANNLNFPIHP